MTTHPAVAIARYYEMVDATKRIATTLGIRQRGRSPATILADIERALECQNYRPHKDRYNNLVPYAPMQSLSCYND